ncbi:B12-binding domain-containing radical SAM protein [Aurantimonas sp. HBX-1]|uniref:B12-binding domain-containing radical SAM protein n=1 Tax=Aurantimonas sp. HBX-1 TaxID=2906072 RepID=UPI001F346728|nr:radical SAM protein [Aurantimonas sp. HBX-1]UIJ73279.1 B12-binding domain-containing radical SAM protein [Aurantimonas sp. HBX-1]
MPGTQPLRVALVGPRETPYGDDPDREHREEMRRSYGEICSDAVALGSDYTLSREFLGIGYLAATLRRAGRLVRIYSAADEGWDDDALVRGLGEFAPHIAGFSLLYDLQLPSALSAAAALKEAHQATFVVFGGPLASAISSLLLENFPFIDAVIEGEGETALARLAEAIEAEGDLGAVPSLVRRHDGSIGRGPRAAPADLDELPHPSRDMIAALRARGLPAPSAYLTTSRGCKAFCTFCTVPNVVRGMGEATYRMRDPRDVVDEMEACVRDLGVTRFYMADDNFLGYGEASNRRMIAFADEILRRGLAIRFHAECRVDSLVPETLQRLRQAGFDQILFGLESGSAKTLKRWAKGQTVEENEAAMTLARRLRLDVMPSIILLDWESGLDEVADTVGFIERTQLWRSSQPLWLVNRLKVHCGTAAARRHDKVRGRPVLPPLDPTDAASRARWCAAATYQKTPIDNPHVAAFWSALNGEANRWSVLVDEILPPLLKSLRDRARQGDGAALDRIRRIAAYRRSIGGALAELMRRLVDEAAEHEALRRPPDGLVATARRTVTAFEEGHFPGGIDGWLAPIRARPASVGSRVARSRAAVA